MLDEKAHIFRLRVYYEDTDAAGIVYYANYFKFAERARTEMLRSVKIDQNVLYTKTGVRFVVRSCAIDYLKPARLDDELEVHTKIQCVKGASLTALQTVRRARDAVVSLKLRIACVGRCGRPKRLPEEVASGLQSYVQVRQGTC
ncbi:MAG: tol-pal system-associated acyl-CoA thioesterase [Rhodospirillaceae bacterium]|nr:tol-pal system-associated acyl-CoA thioesterase [Rhodospirillaceae bacterium]